MQILLSAEGRIELYREMNCSVTTDHFFRNWRFFADQLENRGKMPEK